MNSPRLVNLAVDLVVGTAGLFVRLLEEVTLDGVVDRGASVVLVRLVPELTLLRFVVDEVVAAEVNEEDDDDFGMCDFVVDEDEGAVPLCLKRLALVE